MRIKYKILLVLILSGIVLVSGCTTPQTNDNIPPERYCESDSDCVSNKCCHPDTLINKDFAPNCDKAICTSACISVLDCKKWKPICKNNQCEVKFDE